MPLMSRKMKKPSPSASPKRRRGSDPLHLPRTTKASNDFPLLNLQDVRRGMSGVTSGKDERPSTRSPVIPPKKTIPIKNCLLRTASELQLQEDTVAAEWRDLAMFHRLVQGMRNRQQAQQQERHLVQMKQRMSSSDPTLLDSLFAEDDDEDGDYDDDAAAPEVSTSASTTKRPDNLDDSNHHRACLLQTDRCVEHIIQTRRSHIEALAGSSLSLEDNNYGDDDGWDVNHHDRAALSPGARRSNRRISNGRIVTHLEAYGQFLNGEPDRPSSAPPPLFPDLVAATKDGAQPLFGCGPALVDNDEDGSHSDEVFDLDY